MIFLFCAFIGVILAVIVHYSILDLLEHYLENPNENLRLLPMFINMAIGCFLVFFFWSLLVGSIGVGFVFFSGFNLMIQKVN